MKVFAKYTFTFLFFLIVSGGIAYFLKENLAKVQEVSLSEAKDSAQPLLFQQIEKDLKIQLKEYSSRPIWEISLDEIMQLLKKDKRIETATVRRAFPNRVFVAVTPRKPLMLILGLRGQLHPVANDASLLPPLELNQAPDLPILRGLPFFKDKKQRLSLVKMLGQLPEDGLFSKNSISEIRRDSQGETTFYLVESGQTVLVGDKLDQGLVDRVEQVLKYLKSRSIKGRVIDARFSKKVVVRVRNAS